MPRDPAKALDLYKQAGRENINAANLRLGEVYLHGDLGPPDFAQAKKYLKRAAYGGNAEAATILGDVYRRGLGSAPDPKEAYAWSEVAAIEGNPVARHTRDQLLYSLNTSDESAALARADEIFSVIRLPQSQGLAAGSQQPAATVGGTRSGSAEPVS